ncbi:uncharacterized protein [Apostichopus japonicus]|uniref:uncharacterized protein n=1 Tax=Stichopus japonicus TaxID=307972 RepID=UPI003AB14C22
MLPGSTNPNAQTLHGNNISSYFASENYTTLDYIKRRERTNDADNTSSKVSVPLTKSPNIVYDTRQELTPEGSSSVVTLKTRQFGLRRPLSPSLTFDEIREQSICHEEFADKPYSTVISRAGPLHYDDCFPLLMARSSDAEDKDNIQVQTETRRMSTVTTNYTTGRIKLKGLDSGQSMNLSVFPVLHKDLSSSSEDEDDSVAHEEDCDEDNDDDVFEKEPPLVPMYRRMTLTTSNDTDLISNGLSNSSRRRPSITAGSQPRKPLARLMGRQGPKVMRRRSIASNAISADHFRALQIIRERMRNTTLEEEEDEEDDGSLTEEDEYHLKHAESTMLHLDKNLNTLETFLNRIELTLDKEDAAPGLLSDKTSDFFSRSLQSIFPPAENNDDNICETSSESDDDDNATFW